MQSNQMQVSNERYEIISKRYARFQAALLGDAEPVTVFDPLNQKQLDELFLIREASKDLQKKKDEDINKAEQAEAETKTEVEEAEVESAVTEDA